MGDDSWPAYGTGEEKEYKFMPLEGKCLHFKVKAAHDCHICFTGTPEDTEDMVEVFIGAWEGAGSAIRFKKTQDIVKADTPDILDAEEVREFWITVDDNIVRLGRGGEWEPIIEGELPEPLEITHFGYTTGWGSIGWFQFMHEQNRVTEDCLTYNYQPVYGTSFTFKVACSNDAHIALTSAAEDTERMYEIFIGGWKNEFSAIRLNRDKELTVVKNESSGCLCADEERTFIVTFKNGKIVAKQKGNDEPIVEFIDTNPWQITHVGFCTAWGANGKWKLEV